MKGRILKGIGGFYTVLAEDGSAYICRARGRFRKSGTTPVPGDYVEFDPHEGSDSYLTEILPRQNVLVRPQVANLDQLLIVVAAAAPRIDFFLVDKLCVQCEKLGIAPAIVINKCDIMDAAQYDEILAEYTPSGYPVLSVSAMTGEGIGKVRERMCGCVSCVAGQSAVGKSALLNALVPDANLAVGGLSQKTERGRHTTRHAELLRVPGGGFVFDTPGFSLLDLAMDDPLELAECYPEMRGCREDCRFPSCLHVSEPDCAVKARLKEGKLSRGRYERYCEFVHELIEKRKHQYD